MAQEPAAPEGKLLDPSSFARRQLLSMEMQTIIEFVRYGGTKILQSDNEFVIPLQTKPLAKPTQPRGSVSYDKILMIKSS